MTSGKRNLSELLLKRKISWFSMLFVLPALHLLSKLSKDLSLSDILEGIILNWRDFFRLLWQLLISKISIDIDLDLFAHEYDALTFAVLATGVAVSSVARKDRISLTAYLAELQNLPYVEKTIGIMLLVSTFFAYLFIFGFSNMEEKLSYREGRIFLIQEIVVILLFFIYSLLVWILSKFKNPSGKALIAYRWNGLGAAFLCIFVVIFMRPEFHSQNFETKVLLSSMVISSGGLFVLAFVRDWVSMAKILLFSIVIVLVDGLASFLSGVLVFVQDVLSETTGN